MHDRKVPSFKAEKRAGELYGHTPAVQQQHSRPAGLHPALLALQSGRMGVAFGGSGFGAAYELGAAHMLSNLYCVTNHGTTAVLSCTTPLAGTSAGGFVAAACRCSVSYLEVHSALKKACSDLLQHGQNGRMRSTLQPLIEGLLPANAHELCGGSSAHPAASHSPSPGTAAAAPSGGTPAAPMQPLGAQPAPAPARPAATHTNPTSATLAAAPAAAPPAFVLPATRIRGPCPVCWRGDAEEGGFYSKADLIDRLLVDAHEPLISDGNLFAKRRGKLLVDGGLRLPVPGLPVDYTVIILPMPNQIQSRLWPYKLLMHTPGPARIAISPGQYRPWPYMTYKENNKLVMHPMPPEMLDMLFERGRRDALSWAQHVGLAELLPAASMEHAAAAAAGAHAAPAAGDQPAGTGAGFTDVADAGKLDVLQATRSLLATPAGELPLMLPVTAKLLHFL